MTGDTREIYHLFNPDKALSNEELISDLNPIVRSIMEERKLVPKQ